MQVRVITMRYQEGLQGFPEDALRAATFGKTVLDVREHFFLHGNVPHLALVLQLGDAPAYADAGGFRPRGPDAPDPAEGLTDAQRGVYRALRAWRNETARAEGRLVSALSGTGPHPGRPAFRACGNEHAGARRPVASANAARAPFTAPAGDDRNTGGPRSRAAGGRTDATSASLPFRTSVDPGRHCNLLEGNLT